MKCEISPKGVKIMSYKVAVYCRISREDGDKVESESLGNQRELIKSYAQKNKDMNIIDYYNDDNYSGTNFNRPEFKRMYNDIENGKINCVIVKDLSRFGRDYIDVGNYIQKIFPRYGVRFIAINDNVDSLVTQYDMITPIKNIFNEQYARDISSKIISTFRNKQEAGCFMGAFTSYGYKKDPNNKYKLIIDEYPASIVRRIFKLFCEGHGKISIATILNNEKVLCPSEYKKSIGEKYTNSHKMNNTNYWTYSTINNILKKEIYIGNMVQHKSDCSKFNYGAVQVDEKEWIRVENTHEPIIDKETWELTQSLLKRRTRQLSFDQNVSMFAGFFACGDCGRAMAKTKWGNNVRYVCGTYKKYSKVCTSHSINEDKLKDIVLTDINEILSKIDKIKQIVEVQKKQDSHSQHSTSDDNNDILKIEAQLKRIKHLKKSIYEDYKMGILSQEEFINYKADYDKQEKNITSLINTMKESAQNQEEVILESQFVKQLKDTSKITELDRTVLETFYDKVIIYEDKRIKFKYKFKEIVDTICQY